MNGHPRFYEILEELKQLHSDKNHDYAGDDPLSNLKQCETMGMPAWVGVIVRLTDKMDRLKTYARKRDFKIKNEGLADTFKDMAIYSILGIILYEESQVGVNLHDESKLRTVLSETIRGTEPVENRVETPRPRDIGEPNPNEENY